MGESPQRTHIADRSEVDASRRGLCIEIWVTLAFAFEGVFGVAFAFEGVFGKAVAADLAERLLEAALEAGLLKGYLNAGRQGLQIVDTLAQN